jgi:hypothetical protein
LIKEDNKLSKEKITTNLIENLAEISQTTTKLRTTVKIPR